MKNDSAAAQAQFVKMTQTPVEPLILRLAVPTILSMLISMIYNMADTFFVARLGASATGAVGVVFSLMNIIQAIGFMLGMGSSSISSRRLGERKDDEACESASSAFFAAFALGLIITALGLTFLDPFMRCLGATPTVLPYARDYASWILYGAPIMSSSFVMNTNLRGEGKSFLAMVGIVTGGLLNMVLDPIFIFVFKLGIAGAAIATVLSQFVSFSILLSFFLSGCTVLKLHPRYVSHKIGFYFLIMRTGLPTLCRQGLASIASVLLNVNAAVYGDATLAAMAIVMRVSMFIGSVLMGFGQGFQPVVGYNYGARRFDRVIKAYKFCVRTGSIVLAVLALLFISFAPSVIGFFKTSNQQVTEIGTFALRAHCCGLFVMPVNVLTDMLFQITGRYKQSSFLAIARQGLFYIPSILILSHFFGLRGIQTCQPCADMLTFLCALPMAYSYLRWLRAQPIEISPSENFAEKK